MDFKNTYRETEFNVVSRLERAWGMVRCIEALKSRDVVEKSVLRIVGWLQTASELVYTR